MQCDRLEHNFYAYRIAYVVVVVFFYLHTYYSQY